MTYNFRISTNYLHLEVSKKYNIRFVLCVCAQSCLTLCAPMDCSPPDSSVPGILQARILEWDAISFSKPMGKYCYYLHFIDVVKKKKETKINLPKDIQQVSGRSGLRTQIFLRGSYFLAMAASY